MPRIVVAGGLGMCSSAFYPDETQRDNATNPCVCLAPRARAQCPARSSTVSTWPYSIVRLTAARFDAPSSQCSSHIARSPCGRRYLAYSVVKAPPERGRRHAGIFHLFQAVPRCSFAIRAKDATSTIVNAFRLHMRSRASARDHFQMSERQIGVQPPTMVNSVAALANALRRSLVNRFQCVRMPRALDHAQRARLQ